MGKCRIRVRGFSASSRRSARRLKAIAALRAITMQTRMPAKSSQRNDGGRPGVGRPCHRRRQQRKRQRKQRVAEADQFQQAAEHGYQLSVVSRSIVSGYCPVCCRVTDYRDGYNRQLSTDNHPIPLPIAVSARWQLPNWSQIRETTKSTRSPIRFAPW